MIKMNAVQAQELINLLRETRSLGLTFDCGNAYISRTYIDKQDELKKRISVALKILEAEINVGQTPKATA